MGKNSSELINEAYRLSELRLTSQQASALAADARAMAFAGLALATAAILCGLAKEAYVPLALLLGSGFLVVAAALAGYSARPLDFYMPGAEFNDLNEDIEQGVEFNLVISQLGQFNDKHTKTNHDVMSKNAKFLQAALAVSLLGILVAILPQLREWPASSAINLKAPQPSQLIESTNN
jgi:hypothetical protein